MLTVVQGQFSLIPAARAACFAGACPIPTLKTLPRKTSSTSDGFKFAFLNAPVIDVILYSYDTLSNYLPLIAIAARFGALTEDKLPLKLPNGVLAEPTIQISLSEME